MRNSTKLRHVLKKHNVDLRMDDAGVLEMYLHHKKDKTIAVVEDKQWTSLIDKAYKINKNNYVEQKLPKTP